MTATTDAGPFPAEPGLVVPGPDGTPIAVFSAGAGPGTPVLLVHGTGTDHSTWRVVAPLLASGRRVHALDRRGRGASGDGAGYTAAREVEDVAAVAAALADAAGAPITVAGHSLGGRLALAASLRTSGIARVVAYEGAPGLGEEAAVRRHEALLGALAADLRAGDHDAVLARFMAEAVGMPPGDLAAFRASDLWPRRAATAPQIVRELDAALHDGAIAADALARVDVPVLQLAGSSSPAWFRDGAAALHARLAHGRLEIVEGARHAAHHSHPAAFAAAVARFADGA